MLEVTALDVIHLRNSGGDLFTYFVDELIHANAFLDGIPLGNVHTNLRINIADGGVDTKSDIYSEHSSSIWMKKRAIWQYKASGYSGGDRGLSAEIKKSFSAQCIREGYAYRYCVCDSMPVETKNEWEGIINSAVKEINSDAHKAYVLTADDLAQWVNMFPSIVLKFFRHKLTGLGLHLDAWGSNLTRATPLYLENPHSRNIVERISSHINISSSSTPDVLLTIQGVAGVGKTRLVYETVKKITGAGSLVIYTNDENHALQLAAIIANQSSSKAILVADECSLRARQKIKSLLDGHISRVRIIAIDNSGERPADLSYELWLEKMDSDFLEKILRSNFLAVPIDHIGTYTKLSGGFVRLAADLCANDATISREGHLGASLKSIRSYYLSRISLDERKVVEALSLFSKVGYKDEFEHELRLICEIIGIEFGRFVEEARRLHDVPGFVAIAGRYMYVTPELIGQVAFDEAYKRWVGESLKDFISKLPEPMVESFVKRVAWSAGEVVGRSVSDYFCGWILSLSHSDLADLKTVDRLEAIIEADPSYFSFFRSLVGSADKSQLLQVTGESNLSGRWGSRRYIVWLTERFGAFPEYFYDAEFILRRLAVAENENIGNNATSVWSGLFQIFLSGTAVPFTDRLSLLESLIYSEEEDERELAIEAFSAIFQERTVKMVGDKIVSGKLVPTEWAPKTPSEYYDCLDKCIEVLKNMRQSSKFHAIKSMEIALEHLRRLSRIGRVPELREIFSGDWETIITKSSLLKVLEEVIYFDCKDSSSEICNQLAEWHESLKPNNLEEQINVLIGLNQWHFSLTDKEKDWEAEVKEIAQEIIKQPDVFDRLEGWLFSSEARNSYSLGFFIGAVDSGNIFLDKMLNNALRFEHIGLSQGYIKGISHNLDINGLKRINEFFDRIEEKYPDKAHNLFVFAGSKANALKRTLQLIDKGSLQITSLGSFVRGLQDRNINAAEYKEILYRIYGEAVKGDKGASQILYDYLYQIFTYQAVELKSADSQEIIDITWDVLNDCMPIGTGGLHSWETVLRKLLPTNPNRGASLLTKYISHDDLVFEQHVINLFAEVIKLDPANSMKTLGDALLEGKQSYRFYIRDYKLVFQSFPADILIRWIDTNGVVAARLVARHLPPPYLEDKNKLIVPKLTEYVLTKFGEDERTFNEFCAGIHNFQSFSGDIAEKYKQDAELAKRFLVHPIKAIRMWAKYEMEDALFQAERWKIRQDEMDLK
jgi:hypothetical protein